MKKFLLSLAAAALCSSAATAGEISLQWGSDNWPNNSSYGSTVTSTTSFGGTTWTLEAFNNNNNGWENVRCGRKNNASVASIYNDDALSYTVTKVVVNTKLEKTNDAGKLTSAKLYIAKSSSFENPVVVNYENITEFGDWTFNVPEENAKDGFLKVEFDCQSAANNGFIGVNNFTVYVAEDVEDGGNGGGTTEPDDPNNPGGDDNKDGNVTQPFNVKLGFPDGSANVPTEATTYTATDTGIEYTLYGCYANEGYMMVNSKTYKEAYISWSLDFPMSQLIITTTSGCSTNTNNYANVYAGETLIKKVFVGVQNTTITVNIPEANQAAGTVYKVESDAAATANEQFASFTYVKVGNEVETPDPEIPDAPEGVITVAEALKLLTDGYEGNATVKGVISSITDMSNTESGSTYGNATYLIKDALEDTEALTVYRGYWKDGEKFVTGEEIEVGGTVTVEGKLLIYNGTLEFTSGSKILSYEAPTGGDQPGEDDPDDQFKTLTLNVKDAENIEGDFVEESLKEDGSLNAAAHYQPLSSFEIAGYEFSFTTNSENASQQPAYYCTPSTNANTAPTVRLYNGSSMTIISADDVKMTKIQFKGSNLGKDAEFTVNTGEITTDNNALWKGESNLVTVTTNATWRITSLEITYDSATGIADVEEAAEGVAIYYNLQGVRVNNPERGIFVKVQNGKATKVVK